MCKVIQLYPSQTKELGIPSFSRIGPQISKVLMKIAALTAVKRIVRNAFARKVIIWINDEQICRQLNISPTVLIDLREAGTLPYALVGGEFYYDPTDVESELRRRKRHRRS